MKNGSLVVKIILSLCGSCCGYAYAYLLVLLAASLGGAGHGTSFFYKAVIFPYELGGYLWVLIGACLSFVKTKITKTAIFILLIIHYFGIIFEAFHTGISDVFVTVMQIPMFFAAFAFVYLLGQLLVWRCLLRDKGMD